MSDIQRYTWKQVGEYGPKATYYVTYADHLAAVAAATENAVRDYAEAHYANGVKRYSDGVKAAREAVAAKLHTPTCGCAPCCITNDDIAAIDALEKP